jgi:hypothetical protein
VRQRLLGGARRSITKLSSMFTLSTSAYCALHWLALHHFSIYVLLGAMVFGTIATVIVAWLSDWLPRRA